MLHMPSLHWTAVPWPLAKLMMHRCVSQKPDGGFAGSGGGQSFWLVTPASVWQPLEPCVLGTVALGAGDDGVPDCCPPTLDEPVDPHPATHNVTNARSRSLFTIAPVSRERRRVRIVFGGSRGYPR
jgi:hypothetical protein